MTHAHPDASVVSAADAEPLGLIVGALVANAVQHAHPAGVQGRIDVSSTAAGARLSSIEVEDDGVGLPEAFDEATDGGAGLEAVRRLVRQMGAQLNFNDLGVGLIVRLDLPAAPGGSCKAQEATQ